MTWLLLGAGLVSCVLAVWKTASQWAETIPPTRIDSCELRSARRSHEAWVTTFDSREIETHVHRCPQGEVIEKRRGEFVYRVDGRPLGDWFNALMTPLELLMVAIVALPSGLLLLLVTRWRRSPRAPVQS